jgi:hypothetical protein
MRKFLLLIIFLYISTSCWADSKLSALTNNSSPTGSDLTYDVASGTSYNITLSQVKSYVLTANVGIGSSSPGTALDVQGTIRGTDFQGIKASDIPTLNQNTSGTSSNVTGVVAVANGGTNASSAGITAFNNITGYTASGSTGTTSTNLVFSTSPTLITPVLGTPSSVTLTNGTGLPESGVTSLVASGKTFTSNNSLTLVGTDSTTMTFPTTSATIARTDAANTFTGHQTIEGVTATGATGTGLMVFGTSPTFVTPALGTPSSGVATNLTGTATGLTSGITNALASATTTVNVSSATAPTSGQVLTATSGTAATWQPASVGANYWNYSSSGNIGISTTAAVGIGTTFIGGTGEASFAVMNGNVGIGTWIPTQALSTNGSINTFGNTGNSYLNSTGGNVGIGSTNPGQALDINGTVRALSSGSCSYIYKCVGGVDAGVIQTSACNLCPAGTCTQMNGCF